LGKTSSNNMLPDEAEVGRDTLALLEEKLLSENNK
jgi:hypothetical protein